jgi:hypothetical protein
MNRLEAEVKARGMTVFARIDHAAGAAGAGLSLRPTELLIFGNAKAGTPLMISFIATGLVKVEDGRITDNWHIEDNLTLLKQMGIAHRDP